MPLGGWARERVTTRGVRGRSGGALPAIVGERARGVGVSTPSATKTPTFCNVRVGFFSVY